MTMSMSVIVVVCMMAAFVAPAGARLARASGLSAPTIHERFTVLPCTGPPGHRSTLEQEGCAEHQILAGDKKIDGLNKSIFARLSDNSAKRRFTAGHNAWLSYRRAYCVSRSDVAEGGTEAGVIDASCTAGLNAQHIQSLRDFLSDLTRS